jgi:hypothetical protein
MFLCSDFFEGVCTNSRSGGAVVGVVAALMMIGVSSCAEPLHAQFNSKRSEAHAVQLFANPPLEIQANACDVPTRGASPLDDSVKQFL